MILTFHHKFNFFTRIRSESSCILLEDFPALETFHVLRYAFPFSFFKCYIYVIQSDETFEV